MRKRMKKFKEENKKEEVKREEINKLIKKRPKTRAESKREAKKFIIKKKKRLRSGNKSSQNWNERFYLTDGKFHSDDPISKIFDKTKTGKGFTRNRKSNTFIRLRNIGSHNSKLKRRISTNLSGLKNKNSNFLAQVKREKRWNHRFNMTASKNNQKVFSNYKEFFDTPIDYDVRGYNLTMKPAPMMVYEDENGKADIFRPRFDKKKKKQLAKRLSKERAKTERNKNKKPIFLKNLKLK